MSDPTAVRIAADAAAYALPLPTGGLGHLYVALVRPHPDYLSVQRTGGDDGDRGATLVQRVTLGPRVRSQIP